MYLPDHETNSETPVQLKKKDINNYFKLYLKPCLLLLDLFFTLTCIFLHSLTLVVVCLPDTCPLSADAPIKTDYLSNSPDRNL